MSRMRFRLFSQSVSGNELIGKIPPEIGNLTTLLELYIGYYNAFEDGLPPKIGNLSALVRFDAANCGLAGEIPPEIGKFQNLVSVHSIAAGKKVILFGVPGALTPTCSMNHVPGFIEKAEELKSKGGNEIICFSVNDPFVMKAWGKTYPENKHVKFVADGSGEYTQLLGLELDLKAKGLGVRSRRFTLLLDNLKMTVANVESSGEFTVSSAEDILKSARVYGEPQSNITRLHA